MYRPTAIFNTPLVLLKPIYEDVKGVTQKKYQTIEEGFKFNASFKTYGGTERTVNDIYVIEDTANIETYYDPIFSGDCVIVNLNTMKQYEIIGDPEDIEQRHIFTKFKVRRIGGVA